MLQILKLFIGILLINFVVLNHAKAQNAEDIYSVECIETVKSALDMIHMPAPTFSTVKNEPQAETNVSIIPTDFSTKNIKVRDGVNLNAYHLDKLSNNTTILIHGVMSNAEELLATAKLLSESLNSEVFTIDLRGHGKSEGLPGDVAYIGQYADDIEDVLSILKKEKPDNTFILAGHSMGGGIILNHLQNQTNSTVDGYVLMAPHMGHNAPTLLNQPDRPQVVDAEPFLQVHIMRIIGLKMINALGIKAYNEMPILFFNVGAESKLSTYSYRANESMAPVDYIEAVKAIDTPMIVMVGTDDEAFNAQEYKATIGDKAELHLIENVNHNGVLTSEIAMLKIQKWFSNDIKQMNHE